MFQIRALHESFATHFSTTYVYGTQYLLTFPMICLTRYKTLNQELRDVCSSKSLFPAKPWTHKQLWKFDRNNKRSMSVVSPSPRTTPDEICSYNTSGIDSHGATMKISQSVWHPLQKTAHYMDLQHPLSLSLSLFSTDYNVLLKLKTICRWQKNSSTPKTENLQIVKLWNDVISCKLSSNPSIAKHCSVYVSLHNPRTVSYRSRLHWSSVEWRRRRRLHWRRRRREEEKKREEEERKGREQHRPYFCAVLPKVCETRNPRLPTVRNPPCIPIAHPRVWIVL
jgi:hypothetical protein